MQHLKSETINKITLDSKDLCEYAYLGMSIAVTTRYLNLATTPATVAEQSFATGGTGAGRYAGFDCFGRIIETLWRDGSSTTLQNARYGYNQSSNRIWREDLLAAGKGLGNFYWYDDLYQVTAREQGTLDGTFPDYTGIANPPTEEEDFCYDETGNWLRYDNKGMAGPDPLHQQRQHNKANEITSITNPSSVIQPTYDPAGNMTKLPQPGDWTKGYNVTWDGWNRIVELKDSATSATVARYAYDGLTRRITADSGANTDLRHYYYNRQWRCVEEYLNDDSDPDRRYAWGAQNRWEMILRQRSDTGTLDENLYALYDAMDPVAVVNPGGVVKERYAYSAFGETTILNADFTQRTTGSDYVWNLLFHVEFKDNTELYNYGFRSYHPELGRWLSRDPIGERGGVNLFKMLGNDSPNLQDSYGLDQKNRLGCCSINGLYSAQEVCDCIQLNVYQSHLPAFWQYDRSGVVDSTTTSIYAHKRYGYMGTLEWKNSTHCKCLKVRTLADNYSIGVVKEIEPSGVRIHQFIHSGENDRKWPFGRVGTPTKIGISPALGQSGTVTWKLYAGGGGGKILGNNEKLCQTKGPYKISKDPS